MIALESERMRVEMDPAFGARVTALWDKRAGREWLATGPRVGGEAYGAEQARGWDECFPTVAPGEHPAWGRLRDHGELWGRPWRVAAHGAVARATYEDERFAFARVLELHGATLTARYEVENRSDGPLPYVWSQHCLLAVRPGERIVLEGLSDMTLDGRPVAWPRHGDRDLSVVGDAAEGFAAKLYAMDFDKAASAALVGEGAAIRLTWEGVPSVGLWLDWGGGPADPALGAPVHQLALEPTTSPSDSIGPAEARGLCNRLAPGATHRWSVRLDLLEPDALSA